MKEINHTTLDQSGYIQIHTPNGLVIISNLPKIGTQVLVYDDPDRNPVATVQLRPSNEDN